MDMKKTFIAVVTAVVVGFISAVGLCVRTLAAPKTVGAFSAQELCVVLDAGHVGEMRGISSKILKYADQRVFLPYGSDFRNALSANSAAAVFAFEAYRQRNL